MKRHHLSLIFIATLSIACICCGIAGTHYDSHSQSLWSSTWMAVSFEFRNIFGKAPYWNVFKQNNPALSRDIVVRSLHNEAELHNAHWTDDEENRDITYYRDCRGRCLMLIGHHCDYDFIPANDWHYIRPSGLISFDWWKLLTDLLFVVWIYGLPLLVLGMSITWFCTKIKFE